MYAVLEPVVKVGIDVSIVSGCDGVASFVDFPNGPPPILTATVFLRRNIIGYTCFSVVGHPALRKSNGGIRVDGVVPLKIEPKETTLGFARFVGSEQHEVDIHAGCIRFQMDNKLSPIGRSAVHRSLLNDVPTHYGFSIGLETILVFSDELEQTFTLRGPLFGIRNSRAVHPNERIWQRTHRDKSFVLVCLGNLSFSG